MAWSAAIGKLMMIDLPESVKNELSDSAYDRADPEEVSRALEMFGVNPPVFFVDFYKKYEGPFWSEKLGYELLDLVEDCPNIVGHTKLCREQYEFPNQYLVLTEITTGQVAVLNAETDQVFEVDFEGGDVLLKKGELEPRWNSFKEFVVDYF